MLDAFRRVKLFFRSIGHFLCTFSCWLIGKKHYKSNISKPIKSICDESDEGDKSARIFSAIFTKKMLLVGVVNFVGIIPYYLTGATLMIWFRDVGFSISTIGCVALLNIPHAIKFLWAHLFDSIEVPFLSRFMGLRRSWLFVCHFMAVICIIGISCIDPTLHFVAFFSLTVVANFFIASHNILGLALQMEIIDRKMWGPGEAINVLGFRMGVLFSGAGSLFLSEYFPWSMVYKIIAFMMLPGMFFIYTVKLTDVMTAPQAIYKGGVISHFKQSIVTPMMEFFQMRGIGMILIFMILYSLHDHLLSNMHKIFHLSIGFSKSDVAFVDNAFGMVMTLIGGFIAGMMIRKYDCVQILRIGSFISLGAGLSLMLQDFVGCNIHFLYFTVAIQEMIHGFTMTSFITYQISCCSVKFAVSQLALLKGLDALGKYTFGSASGFLIEYFGWSNFFILIVIAAIPGVIIMNVRCLFKIFNEAATGNNK